VIEAQGIKKSFGKLPVLADVTFSIEQGTVAALVGSNGAGKTTLMRCLLGVSDFEGKACIGGLDVARNGKAVRALVGYLPQNVSYPADWTARSAITFVARLRRANVNLSLDLLERVGLTGHSDRAVAVFSGGMRRRLGLALALVGEPPVLLMDEPTANLDAAGREDFLELVRGLKDGKRTVLFCSHREDEVAEVADRVLSLATGRVTDRGRPRGLEAGKALLKPPHGQRANVLALLRGAGVEARAIELGLALVEVDATELDAVRPKLNGTLSGTAILKLDAGGGRHA
jgi:ABC-type multidrug transport system ATPase subunit